MTPDWILVASAAEARLLQQEEGAPMVVLRAFHHPQSRVRSSVLGDDERGREGSDRRHGATAYEGHVSPQRKEHLRFAAELADALEQGAREHRCRSIRVFAPSPFLGELRHSLGDATQRLLAGMHDVDLCPLPLGEIAERVGHAVAASR